GWGPCGGGKRGRPGALRCPCPSRERRKISMRSCRRTRCLSMFPKARSQRRRISLKPLGQMTKQKSVRW
uniref:Uncharacterized protein n=1 Tax=Buteo japonicus TaxID=224669 RepID=A0A8C0ANU0_9AVES